MLLQQQQHSRFIGALLLEWKGFGSGLDNYSCSGSCFCSWFLILILADNRCWLWQGRLSCCSCSFCWWCRAGIGLGVWVSGSGSRGNGGLCALPTTVQPAAVDEIMLFGWGPDFAFAVASFSFSAPPPVTGTCSCVAVANACGTQNRLYHKMPPADAPAPVPRNFMHTSYQALKMCCTFFLLFWLIFHSVVGS